MTVALILLILRLRSARVEAKDVMDWSPEQISGWLKIEQGISISHERIYQHIWTDKRNGGTLYKHLRQSHKKRKKQYGSSDKRGRIRDCVNIDNRPAIVAEKPASAIGRLIR